MTTSQTRAVLVSVPHGAAAGNMLRGGLLTDVLAADPQLRVVITSPLAADAAFAKEFAHPRVTLELLPTHVPTGLEARLLALMQACYLDSAITESVRIRREEARHNGTIRWIGAKARLARLLAPSLAAAPTRYDLSDRYVSHAWAERLFDTYRPVAAIVSSPGLILSEVPILRTARRRRVRTVAIDPSWDNFTNKLLPVRRVDRLLVWNELMLDQATRWHGYDAAQVTICGVPQFDPYFRAERPPATRDEFFAKIGADPGRRLIALTTTPQALYSHHPAIIRQLSEAIASGRIPPSQLLVRLHPRDQREAYQDILPLPFVIVEKPFRDTINVADGLGVDVDREHQHHLADTLRHSDVAVNVASTIAIEACIFDTPVVNIAYDGDEPCEYPRSARRYYAFTHYVNITRHGAVAVAGNADELVAAIGAYLDDPARDRDGRRAVVLEQCAFLDGRSSARVTQHVIDEIADAARASDPVFATCVALPASSR